MCVCVRVCVFVARACVHYLQEVPDVRVCPFGVWARHLIEGALLSHHEDVHQLSDVVALAGPYDQEVRLWHLMKVDGSSETVVLKGLEGKHTHPDSR